MKKIMATLLSVMLLVAFVPHAMADNNISAVAFNDISATNDISAKDYELSSEVTYVWDDSYAAILRIENKSPYSITSWHLCAYIAGTISDISNARIMSHDDGKAEMVSTPQFDFINVGETLEIGVVVSGKPDDSQIKMVLTGSKDLSKLVPVILNENPSANDYDGFYLVDKEVHSLSGVITCKGEIFSLMYTLENEYGEILMSGKLPAKSSWEIMGFGLDVGYNKLTLAGESSIGAFRGELAFVNIDIENVKKLNIDLTSDTDGDSICDYLEPRLGLDPNNAHSLSSVKTDFECIWGYQNQDNSVAEEEMSIIIPTETRENLAETQATSVNNMVIHRTYKPEGKRYDYYYYSPLVALDLTYNNYSYEELCEIKPALSKANTATEESLWNNVAILIVTAKATGTSSMDAVVDEMFEMFRSGEQTGSSVEETDYFYAEDFSVYNGSTFNNAFALDSRTVSYLYKIVNFVESYLSNGGSVSDLQYNISDRWTGGNVIEAYAESFVNSPYPTYGGAGPYGLLVHAWHGHTISLVNYTETSTGFTGTLSFHFYDHFGLDTDDEIDNIGFADWFILQHYTRYNGKYAPFITHCNATVPIAGSFE